MINVPKLDRKLPKNSKIFYEAQRKMEQYVILKYYLKMKERQLMMGNNLWLTIFNTELLYLALILELK